MTDQIRKVVEPIVQDLNCYIDNIEFVQEKSDYYLRIYCDLNEGHIDMDAIVALSEKISERLDEVDLIKQEYILEVSSPGAERELKTYDQVVKAVGEYVYIKLKDPKSGFDELYGTITNINQDDLDIEYMVKNIKKKLTVNYKNISFIRLAIKF